MEAAALTEVRGRSASVVSGLTVETISDFRSFLALEAVWNDLVERAGVNHPFLTHDWVRTWWECFGTGKDLHILVVKAGEEVTAIAPFMRSHGRMYGLPVRQMEFIANRYTERFDVVVAHRHEESYRAIWRDLVGCSARWDVLNLRQLPAGSRTLDELPRLAAEEGFLSGLWRSGNSPYLPLHGTWDGYVKGLDQKHRSNLRNRLKRLTRLGPLELQVVSSAEQLRNDLAEGLRIEAAAWKGKARTAILCLPELRLFYTKLAERAAQRGWLRLQFLTVDHRRIAFHYSLCYKNTLFLLKPGYDPTYAPYSPSNLLCEQVLRNAFERGITEFDFLGAPENWKLDWTQHTRPHSWLFVFPNRPQTRLLHWGKFRLVPSLRRLRLCTAPRDAVWGRGSD